MPAVSNTSPILSLAIIGKLDLLKIQFGQILIPKEVRAELKTETDLAGTEIIRQSLADWWMREIQIEDDDLFRALALELDRGESAAIVLALEQKTRVILMDEHDGRAKAKAMGLQPVGVLGILLRAKRSGDLASVKDAMETLRRDAGFFIGDDLYAEILDEANEKS
ncbi:MAG: DUF3368 domain-containing protein [Chloroflexi bacterium]|nr:DUF3368 domain-containing protein [Chloroflexota bacterium]